MKRQDLNFITKAMINHLFCFGRNSLTKEELIHVCENMHYPAVEDRYLADDPSAYPYIKWDRLDKMQAIRLVTRNQDLLEKIDLKKYEYRVREVFFFIQKDYKHIFKYFNFDFSNLVQDDAYFILCFGKDEFLDLIDIRKYKFSFIESFEIIKAYNFKREVVELLNYEELKSYQIAEILIMTGEEFLDLFDLDVLTTLDWLKLLMYQPGFIHKCDFEKFVEGDPFNLVQLIVLFEKPDLSNLLEKIDLKKITPFGWEKLLIYNAEKFAPLCDFSKLNESNWVSLLEESPELLKYKQN